MNVNKERFIKFCLKNNILKFGDFTLKSGRKSPYFFNAGLFNSGNLLKELGGFYAYAIYTAKLEYDVIFGPAYKGIPLAVATAIALASDYNIDKPIVFNRKEIKSYGEGGNLIGAPLKGKVLLIDDVITAGTAAREAVEIIENNGAKLCTIIIALDRQEKGESDKSAIAELEEKYALNVTSIINLVDLLEFVKTTSEFKQWFAKIELYRENYGA